MEQTTTTNQSVCEACNCYVQVTNKAYEQHVNGKKHKMKQEQYDKNYKTIFVSGTNKLSQQDLHNIFWKYGEICKVHKQEAKGFSFIQFVQKESVERVLAARVYVGGKRLFIRRYVDNRNKPYGEEKQQDIKEKSRKLSETLSNTSQTEGEAAQGPGMGVRELPVHIAEVDSCTAEDVVLWQAQEFVSQVELSAEMYQNLAEVKSDMENLFRPLLPGCEAVVFGSCGSTLAFKNSDVDLFLQLPEGKQPQDFVRREAKEMYRSRHFRVITRIPAARVPIVKFEHLRTGWHGDLTANSQLGVCNSQLIRFLVSLDPRIKPLMMVIKYWSKVCGVTGNHTRFTTYSLMMLVIFYLQQLDPPLLPSIAQLQQMSQHKQYCLGWECSFCSEESRVHAECLTRPNDLSLRQLLTGFFRFYHTFDYINVMCPLLGKCIPVKDFESGNTSELPEEMFLYGENLKSDPKCKFRTDVNCRMQDPFELCLNITRNVAEKTFSVFKQACKVSLELCEKEDAGLVLKSLFSIDEASLDVGENCLKVFINYKEGSSDTKEAAENASAQWYRLTTDSILLVFKQIFKFNVDPQSCEVSSKVKKLETSQDVHSPANNHNGDKMVFVCSGRANVWNSRRKMSKFMNSSNIGLNPFEREVCISRALYHPNDHNLFHFTLTISSLKDLKKKGRNGIEVQINVKKQQHPLIKGFLNSVKTDFTVFVHKAQAFINKVESSSPVSEVKESLKELFELKLENLPDLKKLMMDRNEIRAGNGKQHIAAEKVKNSSAEKIKIVSAFLGNSNDSGERKTDDDPTKTSLNRNGDKEIPVEKSEQVRPTESKIAPVKVKSKMMDCNHTSKKELSKSEKEKLIDEFFKPPTPDQITDLRADNISEYIEGNEFGDLLSAIKKIETQSSFAAVSNNPFLASIEKVSIKSLNDNKNKKADDTGDISRKNEENQESIPFLASIEKISVKSLNDSKNEKADEIGDISRKNEENQESINNNEKETENFETIQPIENESGKSTINETSNPFEERKYQVQSKLDNDEALKPNNLEILPSSSQTQTNEKSTGSKVGKVASSDGSKIEQKVDTKVGLQRPKIYSERPIKQKKPNTNRLNRIAVRQPNKSWSSSPWAGGDAPHGQPWSYRSQGSQPHPPPPKRQDYQGNHHRGNGRHPSNRNIEQQRKCYPSLFKDENY